VEATFGLFVLPALLLVSFSLASGSRQLRVWLFAIAALGFSLVTFAFWLYRSSTPPTSQLFAEISFLYLAPVAASALTAGVAGLATRRTPIVALSVGCAYYVSLLCAITVAVGWRVIQK
jgi:hypothetical protein